MDATDVRILRTMGLLPFQRTPRDLADLRAAGVAARLSLTPRTVKERLRALRDEGVLVGFEAYPNLRLLDLVWKSFHFRIADRPKAQVLAEILPLDGLVSATDFLGPDLCVDLYYGDDAELARRLRLLSTLTGGAQPVEWFDNRMPAVDVGLTPLDWRIVRALRGDGLRGPEAVAADVGVAPRTVRRRLGRMLEGHALDVVPVVDLGRAEHVIPFALLFTLAPEAAGPTIRTLLQAHESRYFWYWSPPTRDLASFVVFLHATSTGEVEDLRRRAEALPGVERAAAIVPCGGFENGAWLDTAIARAAAVAGSGSGAVGNGHPAPTSVRR